MGEGRLQMPDEDLPERGILILRRDLDTYIPPF